MSYYFQVAAKNKLPQESLNVVFLVFGQFRMHFQIIVTFLDHFGVHRAFHHFAKMQERNIFTCADLLYAFAY